MSSGRGPPISTNDPCAIGNDFLPLRRSETIIDPPTLRPGDYLRFVQIEPFPSRWANLRLTDDDLRSLEIAIMSGPERSDVIPGGNGLRKLRFRRVKGDQGKSGGYRVYSVRFPDFGLVLLMAVLSKSDRADPSKADLKALADVIARVEG